MKRIIVQLLVVFLFAHIYGCVSKKNKKEIKNVEIIKNSEIDSLVYQLQAKPKLAYVVYGFYCGECYRDCTRMYKHNLTGNNKILWTDKTDSYWKGLKFETKMPKEAEQIGIELVNKIPESILKSKKGTNTFGCPDCDDGCGLEFEFQFDNPNSKPVLFRFEYSLNGTTGDIKKFGELIKNTIEKLEKFR